MKQKNYRGRRAAKKKRGLIKMGVVLILLAGLAMMAWKVREEYFKTHFEKNTIIEGVDCSYLNVEETANAISDALNQKTFTLIFKDSNYKAQGEVFGIGLRNTDEISAILESQQQRQNGDKTYTLENSIIVSKPRTSKFLRSIKELQSKNMVSPQDAYIKQQDDGTLVIEKEVIGSKINYYEALSLCVESVENGDTTIDFTPLIVQPKVFSTDINLNKNVEEVNRILDATINYQLADGNTFSLNKEITKTWVTTDENGNYYVDFENVNSFVEELNTQAKQSVGILKFIPTDKVNAMELAGKLKVEVDTEKEAKQIIEDLTEGGEHNRKPIYKEGFSPEELLSYVEVDITRQMVWVYVNGECVLTTPCVTGLPPKHSTPTGVFYLTAKIPGQYLTGYNDDGSRYSSWVDYWIPFNGDIGFHDANWQPVFGGTWYLTHGSHGCVNLPHQAAQTLYSYINASMPIIVYCS